MHEHDVKEVKSLGKLNFCLKCGKKADKAVFLDVDHLYPKCMLGPRRKRSSMGSHPFKAVVYQQANRFTLCRPEHEELDRQKCGTFLEILIKGPSGKEFSQSAELGQSLEDPQRGNPVALVEFLIDNYPITDNPEYFPWQISCMVRTNEIYQVILNQLNGCIYPELRARYHRSGLLVTEFNKKLVALPAPEYHPMVDFIGVNTYNPHNQTSGSLLS